MDCLEDKIKRTVQTLLHERAVQDQTRERFGALAKVGWIVGDDSAHFDIDSNGAVSVIVRVKDGQLELATNLDVGYCPIKDEAEAIKAVEELRSRLFAAGWSEAEAK